MTDIWTIGHSTHDYDTFVGLLLHNGIGCLVDVRTFPGSRRCPHFNRWDLLRSLASDRVAYEYLGADLGGRRSPRVPVISDNAAWRNPSFRAFADHTLTADFTRGMDALGRIADRIPTAICCAEALPWRCHRTIIADAALARGWRVHHIMRDDNVREHALPSFARVVAGRLSYPVATLRDDGENSR